VGGVRDRELVASLLRLLAAVGRPDHVPAIRPYCDSEDAVVRAQALKALGALGDNDDVPVLVDAMDDPSPWPALYAARGVGEVGGLETLSDLASSEHPSAALAAQVLAERKSR
jgi:HEAT repeat protein